MRSLFHVFPANRLAMVLKKTKPKATFMEINDKKTQKPNQNNPDLVASYDIYPENRSGQWHSQGGHGCMSPHCT